MKILLCYIEKDEKLKICLDSLKQYSPEIEVVHLFVENPSEKTDPFIEYNKYFETMDDDVMIWHPDMIATQDWFENLKKFYELFDVIGTKLLYPNGLVQHFGGAIGPDGRGHHPHQGALNIGLNFPMDCAYVTGPGTVIKKKVIDKIRGFDLRFIKGFYGDVDFCFRAREEGFTVGVVPVTLIHNEGADVLQKRPKWKTDMLQTKNYHDFVTKHMQTLARYK